MSLPHEVCTNVVDVWHYETAPVEQQAVLYSTAISPRGSELSKASERGIVFIKTPKPFC